MNLDAVVFGGGVAGLWTLDELVRNGCSALLLEGGDLGSGQTVASQGILHGGLKYTLTGWLTGSAKHVREMPAVWRDCLETRREPHLDRTVVRAEHCHLWRTESLQSKLGMIGARIGLRVAPKNLSPADRPPVLARCPGAVAQLDEQVIAPASLVANLLDLHRKRILRIDATNGLDIATGNDQRVDAIHLRNPDNGERLELRPRHVVLAAGGGNASLRERMGLATPVMQRRPLHMVLVRGNLPTLNGHCVDGARTRITVTSVGDSAGRTVWQVGGQIAEDGVERDELELVAAAREEVTDCIPGLDTTGLEWATYRVDRAEAVTRGNKRPETFQILEDGNVLTVWPTKLVLAPRLAAEIARRTRAASTPSVFETLVTNQWPRPDVARPPWETATRWHHLDATPDQPGDARRIA